MNPKNTTALNLVHGNTLHDLRRSIWLWLHLQSYEAASFDPATCNSDDMREITTEYLNGREDILVGNIQEEMTRTLLPNEHFDWIGEDARLIAWLLPRLEDLSDLRDFQSLPRLKGRNLVVGIADLWDESLSNKAAALDRLHAQWRRHKALDTQLKWFSDKKEGNSRCEYAWRWIEKNERRALFRRPLPFENYRELLVFFDTTDLRERERKDIVQSIRQSWNRQKYLERLEGKKKKQYNFTLSDKAIELLDRMAEDQDMKRPQMLELLITQESERGTHLSKNRRSDD
ncbi:hypothetical protein [Pseudomonas sp. HY7a-MNA-CIBAN-0227]|uniref:hypothetical protein n=1 Tax=Pseudomonas sp. HY7a-MNA-CIBAN-0227 TaxID=3140474 RepID=UPI003329F7D2